MARIHASLLLAVALVALAASSAAAADQQQGTKAATPTATTTKQPTASFGSFDAALGAAANSNISTFLAAVKAAGVLSAVNSTKAWTILAPTNDGIARRLQKALNVTPAFLLQPANRDLLVKVLSFHVIPSGAVLSSQLRDGQELKTALTAAGPLKVKIYTATKNGTPLPAPKVKFAAPGSNSAAVVVPDIAVGRSVVHVVDDLLLPAGVGAPPSGEKKKKTDGGGGGGGGKVGYGGGGGARRLL